MRPRSWSSQEGRRGQPYRAWRRAAPCQAGSPGSRAAGPERAGFATCRNLGHGGLKPETGLDADGQQIQRIRQGPADVELPRIDAGLQPELRQEEPNDGEDDDNQQDLAEGPAVGRKQADQQHETAEEGRANKARGQKGGRLDAAGVPGDLQLAGCILQDLLRREP